MLAGGAEELLPTRQGVPDYVAEFRGVFAGQREGFAVDSDANLAVVYAGSDGLFTVRELDQEPEYSAAYASGVDAPLKRYLVCRPLR
ncbi:hypothetical protein [Halobacterium zhouii]|uniref:hypothetical protein n=1 Tax=Halobacterium zhouii TaxID=2902624 RepID=UPI001E55A35D|nr:hypothetical protein [Halobacterium zhouii]